MQQSSSIRQSPVALIVGVVVLIALLTWAGGWALPFVIFAVIAIVMGHEFGHFITAKRAGLLVTDFFVGFGPIVWSTTRGETRYGVRAFILGGYVKVPGMSWTEKIDPALEKRTYRASSYPKKVLFASAGSLMHVLMALILAWASLAFIGQPSPSHVDIAQFSTWDGHKETVAQLAGLKVGDQIVAVDGTKITSATQLDTVVHNSIGTSLTLSVLRGGKNLTLHATPVNGQNIDVNGTPLVPSSAAPSGYIGISIGEATVHSSLFGAVPGAFSYVGTAISSTASSLVRVFSLHEFLSLFHQVASPAAANNKTNQQTRPESIVGVVRIAVQGAQNGWSTLIAILVIVNIFIGVLNMLPILPLDGGYVAIATYERLRSRRGARYHADINRLAPVIYAFMSVLLVLFACTLYLDIAHPIANPFN
ncbi:MAG TPA: M50 family metallopeptidase [Acidimicrobiales bacterium]